MAIELYLIRHGIAAERGTYANDDERPLIPKGEQKTQQVAQRLQELGITFDLILTSPLVRAQQTADILQAVGLGSSVQILAQLAPGGECDRALADLATSLKSLDQPTRIAFVGHEPDLSLWAEQLISNTTLGNIQLKKAGIIGLSLPDDLATALGNSELFWLTPPRLLLSQS